MKKLFIIALAASALLCACNRAEQPTTGTPTPIRFSLVGEFAFTKATEAALENDDEIQIIAGAPVNGASKATVAGTSLNLTSPLYWAPGQTAATDFVAIYPYSNTTSTTLNYNLFNNNQHDYAYHKMFMTAHVSSTPTDQSVVLPFKHPFSKVIINITNQLGADVVESVVVKGVKMEAIINLANDAIDFGDAQAVDVPASLIATNSYGLIVMPQTAQPTIEVTTHLGSVYTFTTTSAFSFEAGKIATASLTLSGQGGGGETPGDPIGFGFTVANWVAVETEPGFDQSSVAMGAYWYAIGCLYTDDNTLAAWGKDFPMTYKGKSGNDDIWEITINYDETMAGDVEVNKGFKFRKFADGDTDKWAVQLGMWGDDTNTTMNILYDYGLASSNNKNIRFSEAGNYTLNLTGNTLTVVKND